LLKSELINKLILMDLNQIRHFIAVAEAGSFTKGAQNVAVSQSAISTSIAKIEAELDVKLLDRRLSPLGLTPAGKRLLEAGKDILQRYDTVTADLKSISEPKHLRIGVLRSLLLFDGAVSNLLSSFKRANPHVATKVVDDECEHLTGLLAGQEIDTILTMIRGDESEFANRALYKMPYMLAVREDHRFANQHAVTLSDLADEPFILPTRGVNLQDLMKALASRDIKIKVVSQTDNVYRALALVAAGIGVAVVPGHFEVASIKQVPVKDLNISRTIGLIWPRERRNGSLAEFIRFAESHCVTV
jgi:DNA-binding transcriptional LysR family regulator